MENLYGQLNVQIANWSILYTKLHRYHWYVKGPLFFSLHAKFEELYNEAATNVDSLAENLLAAGGAPISTLSEFIEHSTIKEVTTDLTANEMVADLISDYKHLKIELETLADTATEFKKDSVNDLALDIIAQIDLHVWMLSAHLG